ncbi:MAG TPA: ABC transporter permease [Actinomycetota bacterium]|nr:ABC transporter permease [Actinomycetota bacterium]
MSKVLLSRLVSLIVILIALSAIVFVLEAVIPSDPVRVMVGASASRQAVQAERVKLGMNKPLPVQYLLFVGRALEGNLAESLHTHRPVTSDLAQFLPATIELAGAAAVLALVLGTFLGLATARGKGTAARLLMLAGASAPPFLLALALVLAFYSHWHLFPASGDISANLAAPTGPTHIVVLDGLLHGNLRVVSDGLWHLALPSICLALGPAVAIGRTLRSSLQTVLAQDHIRTARAKGLKERTVLLRHALRSALNAPLTMTGLQIGLMLAGVVVIESVFAWPGIGLYTVQSITATDFPAIAGVTLVLGALYVVVNTVVDLAQMAADPRLRAS